MYLYSPHESVHSDQQVFECPLYVQAPCWDEKDLEGSSSHGIYNLPEEDKSGHTMSAGGSAINLTQVSGE